MGAWSWDNLSAEDKGRLIEQVQDKGATAIALKLASGYEALGLALLLTGLVERYRRELEVVLLPGTLMPAPRHIAEAVAA